MNRKFWNESRRIVLVLVFVTGCGARSKEAAPAQAPGSQPAYSAPEAEKSPPKDEESASDRASGESKQESLSPRPAAPAAGSALPGSTTRESKGGEPMDEIEALSKRLDGALTLSTPDCTSAWSFRDRICDLADRICDLANRSAERDVAERCTDGRSRCQRATSRVRESCGR
jgi:hypothetical protein